MERRREIAAAPVRSAFEAWKVVCKLLADTLARSAAIPAGSVVKELAPLNGIGPALIAGGHLESKGLVLIDSALYVTVVVVTGDAALGVEENLNPVPGGGSATDGWILYLPPAGPLDEHVSNAVKGSMHLSVEAPPASPPSKAESEKRESLLDLDALHNGTKP